MKNLAISITEALKLQRPTDKVVRVLSNKFAIVKCEYTNGSYSTDEIMGLTNGQVYGFGRVADANSRFELVESIRNIEPTVICYNHSENGKPYHYIVKNCDNRKWKQVFRRLKRVLQSASSC